MTYDSRMKPLRSITSYCLLCKTLAVDFRHCRPRAPLAAKRLGEIPLDIDATDPMDFLHTAWQVMDEFKRRTTVVRDLEAEVAFLEYETRWLRSNALKTEEPSLGIGELRERGTDR